MSWKDGEQNVREKNTLKLKTSQVFMFKLENITGGEEAQTQLE